MMKVIQLSNNCYAMMGKKFYTLQSYESTVAIYNIKSKKLVLGRHWDYSNTTLKHLYRFFEEFLPQIDLGKYKKRTIEKMLESGEIEYSDMLI